MAELGCEPRLSDRPSGLMSYLESTCHEGSRANDQGLAADTSAWKRVGEIPGQMTYYERSAMRSLLYTCPRLIESSAWLYTAYNF